MLGRRLALATAIAMASLGATGFTQPTPQLTISAPRKARLGLFNGSVTPGWGGSYRFTYMRHGPTAAQQKRASRKARNVKRHKQHVRG